jgi:hypothetical protein
MVATEAVVAVRGVFESRRDELHDIGNASISNAVNQ